MAHGSARATTRGLIKCPSTGRIFVRESYDRNFVEGARRLRGRWKGEDVGWVFEPTVEEQVRQLHTRIYGSAASGVHGLITAMMIVPSLDQETIRLGKRIIVRWKRATAGSQFTLPTYELVVGPGVEMRSGALTTFAGVIAVERGSTFVVRDIDPTLIDARHHQWRIERADEAVPA